MGRPKGSTNKAKKETKKAKKETKKEEPKKQEEEVVDLEVETEGETSEEEVSLETLEEEEKEEPKNSEVTPESDNWYKTGDAGYQEMLKQEAVAKARREKGVKRFWLKPEEEAVVVFLDNPAFYVWEHEVNISGDWKQRAYLTCSKEMAPCDVCGDGHNPYYIAYGTIFDTRKYTSEKEGDKVYQGRSLFGAKKTTMHRIMDLVKQYGDLRGRAFRIKRYPGDKEPKVGSSFEHIGKVDLVKQFGKDDSQVFDYKKILAHPTKEELKAYGIKSITFGSEEDTEDNDVDLSFL